MSLLRDAFATVRRIAALDTDVRRLEREIEKLDQRTYDHGNRISRIEGLIEFATRGGPPRLPKR